MWHRARGYYEDQCDVCGPWKQSREVGDQLCPMYILHFKYIEYSDHWKFLCTYMATTLFIAAASPKVKVTTTSASLELPKSVFCKFLLRSKKVCFHLGTYQVVESFSFVRCWSRPFVRSIQAFIFHLLAPLGVFSLMCENGHMMKVLTELPPSVFWSHWQCWFCR